MRRTAKIEHARKSDHERGAAKFDRQKQQVARRGICVRNSSSRRSSSVMRTLIWLIFSVVFEISFGAKERDGVCGVSGIVQTNDIFHGVEPS